MAEAAVAEVQNMEAGVKPEAEIKAEVETPKVPVRPAKLVGEMIVDYMTRHDMSQRQFAEKASSSPESVKFWVSGELTPGATKLAILKPLLGDDVEKAAEWQRYAAKEARAEQDRSLSIVSAYEVSLAQLDLITTAMNESDADIGADREEWGVLNGNVVEEIQGLFEQIPDEALSKPIPSKVLSTYPSIKPTRNQIRDAAVLNLRKAAAAIKADSDLEDLETEALEVAVNDLAEFSIPRFSTRRAPVTQPKAETETEAEEATDE